MRATLARRLVFVSLIASLTQACSPEYQKRLEQRIAERHAQNTAPGSTDSSTSIFDKAPRVNPMEGRNARTRARSDSRAQGPGFAGPPVTEANLAAITWRESQVYGLFSRHPFDYSADRYEQYPRVALEVFEQPAQSVHSHTVRLNARRRCYQIGGVLWHSKTKSEQLEPFTWCYPNDAVVEVGCADIHQCWHPGGAPISRSGDFVRNTGKARTYGPIWPRYAVPQDRYHVEFFYRTGVGQSPGATALDVPFDKMSTNGRMVCSIVHGAGIDYTSDQDRRLWFVGWHQSGAPYLGDSKRRAALNTPKSSNNTGITPRLANAVQRHFRRELKVMSSYDPDMSRDAYFAENYNLLADDLNGDGKKEIIAYVSASGHSVTYLLTPTDSGFERVMLGGGARSVEVLSSRTDGWKDLLFDGEYRWRYSESRGKYEEFGPV